MKRRRIDSLPEVRRPTVWSRVGSIFLRRRIGVSGYEPPPGPRRRRRRRPQKCCPSLYLRFQSNSLSDQPLSKLGTGSDVPYRIAVHRRRRSYIFITQKLHVCTIPDGKFLISLGSGSGCPSRIWDVSTSTVISYLAKENDEVFGFCRFSQTTDTYLFLYVTSNRDNGGSIVKLNTNTWQRISSGHVHNSISAYNGSPDGKLLAVGTNEGDILIMSSASMRWHTFVRKSHLGPVTSMAFSPDSRALISVSLDSSEGLH